MHSCRWWSSSVWIIEEVLETKHIILVRTYVCVHTCTWRSNKAQLCVLYIYTCSKLLQSCCLTYMLTKGFVCVCKVYVQTEPTLCQSVWNTIYKLFITVECSLAVVNYVILCIAL